MTNLIDLIDMILLQLADKIQSEPNPEKLKLLLAKYQTARAEIIETGHVDTNLIGCVKAYLDSYSDYMDNPLLDNMYRVEKILK